MIFVFWEGESEQEYFKFVKQEFQEKANVIKNMMEQSSMIMSRLNRVDKKESNEDEYYRLLDELISKSVAPCKTAGAGKG